MNRQPSRVCQKTKPSNPACTVTYDLHSRSFSYWNKLMSFIRRWAQFAMFQNHKHFSCSSFSDIHNNHQVQPTKHPQQQQQYWPTNFFMIVANSETVCSSGLPMLTGRLKLLFIRATRPSTRSVTYWKDLVCLPSPYTCHEKHTAFN